ncbi:hypothetical protein Vafri_7763 [Volvox africanus]|nr:hypothetical protein Vafri_7763 [Volvox africanus]
MDVYLALTPAVPVSMLQLVGISSLRMALRVLQEQKNVCSETKTKPTWETPIMQDVSTAAAASLATAVPLSCGRLNSTRSTELGRPRPCLKRRSTWNSDEDSDSDCDVADDVDAIVTKDVSPNVRGGKGKATTRDPSPSSSSSPPPPPPTSSSVPPIVIEPLCAATAVDLCADTYSVEDVERMTTCVADLVLQLNSDGERIRQGPWVAPTARHFFRGLWAVAAAAVAPMAALHLAGFLLHVSLMCPSCSAAPPSHVAAAALSLAMEVLGQPPWPPTLQRTMPLSLDEDLGPVRARIIAAQMKYDLPYMRGSWIEELSEACWSMDGKPLDKPFSAGEGTAVAACCGGGSSGERLDAGETTPSDRGAGGDVAGGPAGSGTDGAASTGGSGCGVAANVAAMRQIVEFVVQRKGPLLPVEAMG